MPLTPWWWTQAAALPCSYSQSREGEMHGTSPQLSHPISSCHMNRTVVQSGKAGQGSQVVRNSKYLAKWPNGESEEEAQKSEKNNKQNLKSVDGVSVQV